MRRSETLLKSLLLNILYGIVLLNIASGLLVIAIHFNISHELSILLVILYFFLELLLFFSYIPSPGIFILSLLLIIPCLVSKKLKVSNIPKVPTRIKCNISKFSESLLIDVFKN